MRKLRIAYRDHDRAPVSFCIKEMAERCYNLGVDVLHIPGQKEFEAAIFDRSCEVILDHLEYLFTEAGKGKKVTFFCAPQIYRGLQLVLPKEINGIEELRGKTMAVRDFGRPHAITLWLRKLGLEREVKTVIVKDHDIGRWQQWRKVASGECAACFVEPMFLPDALDAGLKVLPVPEVPVISLYAQACASEYARQNSALLEDYVKAVVHALCLLVYRKKEALEIIRKEPMKRMGIDDLKEMERRVDCITVNLQVKPYPTAEAIINTNEIAATEYGGGLENPLALWDLHWVKQLDDEGFIDRLIKQMAP